MNTQFAIFTIITFTSIATGINLLVFSKNLIKKIAGLFFIRIGSVLLLIDLYFLFNFTATDAYINQGDYHIFVICSAIIIAGMISDIFILINIYTRISDDKDEITNVRGGEVD